MFLIVSTCYVLMRCKYLDVSHTCTLLVILAFDLCRFCVMILFFHPRHNGQWPPWLGIEPGTSRTRTQHSTTRLSRRRSRTDWLNINVGVQHVTVADKATIKKYVSWMIVNITLQFTHMLTSLVVRFRCWV